MKQALKYCLYVFCGFLIAYALTYTVMHKFSQYNGPEHFQYITMKERTRQLECLAKNIYYEAGFEPFEGKVGVAQVTLNRAADSRFPQDICQVVYQKNVFYQKVVCQFSWYCEHDYKTRRVNEDAYRESYEVAKKVLLEGFRLEGLNEAIYYHADYVHPNWKKQRITKIGQHIFYKDI